MMPKQLRVFLVAPNVSTQLGGEAFKALQIFEELHAHLGDVIQITHARNRQELSRHLLAKHIYFLADDWVDRLLWRSVILRALMTFWFSYRSVRYAEKLADTEIDSKVVIIHQTEPNSPVAFRWTSARCKNVFGPINGNIYYPKCFRRHESLAAKVRRTLHMPIQLLNRLHRRGIRNADLILAAGGPRTVSSLLAAGVARDRIYETLDCGIGEQGFVAATPRPAGARGRFIHFGRLVFHKGTHLAIEAIAMCASNAKLDVVGRGPELEKCKALCRRLGLDNRVQFLDWYESRGELIASLAQYEGMILPSIEDANGMVVQEAMAAGLIPICLDWGGPQLLIEHLISGFLIEVSSKEQIPTRIANYIDLIAADPHLANNLSQTAVNRAAEWRWHGLARAWIAQYEKLLISSERCYNVAA
jgi:glycosyltransferase involved in cell wall biosynthesis